MDDCINSLATLSDKLVELADACGSLAKELKKVKGGLSQLGIARGAVVGNPPPLGDVLAEHRDEQGRSNTLIDSFRPIIPTEQSPHRTDGEYSIDIFDDVGMRVGSVVNENARYQYVQLLRCLSVKRQVKIRRNLKLTGENLNCCRDNKWLSAMIQSTGAKQTNQCQYCREGQGAFPDCITLGGPVFPKCGNCAWDERRCSWAVSKPLDTALECASDSAGERDDVVHGSSRIPASNADATRPTTFPTGPPCETGSSFQQEPELEKHRLTGRNKSCETSNFTVRTAWTCLNQPDQSTSTSGKTATPPNGPAQASNVPSVSSKAILTTTTTEETSKRRSGKSRRSGRSKCGGVKAKFTPEEDDLLKFLKEEQQLSWIEIHRSHKR